AARNPIARRARRLPSRRCPAAAPASVSFPLAARRRPQRGPVRLRIRVYPRPATRRRGIAGEGPRDLQLSLAAPDRPRSGTDRALRRAYGALHGAALPREGGGP